MISDAQAIELEARLAKARAEAETAKRMQAKAQEFGERMRAERDDSERRLDAIATLLGDLREEHGKGILLIRDVIWNQIINAPAPFNRTVALAASRRVEAES